MGDPTTVPTIDAGREFPAWNADASPAAGLVLLVTEDVPPRDKLPARILHCVWLC